MRKIVFTLIGLIALFSLIRGLSDIGDVDKTPPPVVIAGY